MSVDSTPKVCRFLLVESRLVKPQSLYFRETLIIEVRFALPLLSTSA